MKALAYGGVMDGKVLQGPVPVCNVPTIPMGKRQVYVARKFAAVIAGEVVSGNAWVLKGAEMPSATTVIMESMVHEIRGLKDRLALSEPDAERYRWLCDGNGYFMEENGLCGHGPEKEKADAAIDAERNLTPA